MTYMVARLYSGAGAQGNDELARVTVRELCPQLAQAGGLQRYGAAEFSGGRIGSVSAYESKASANRAAQVASAWVKESGALQGYKLAQTMEGECVFAYRAEGADQAHPKASGVIRVYQTPAGVAELQAALEKEATVIAGSVSGFLRYEVIKLEEGGYASLV